MQLRVPLSLVPAISELLTAHVRAVQAGSILTPARDRARAATRRLRAPNVPPPGRVCLEGPITAVDQLERLAFAGVRAATVILDPWYRQKSAPGRAAFLAEALPLLQAASMVGDHVFLWGWPEALGRLMDHLPRHLVFEAWLTWSFKNAPSRAKGWRPAQQACLHLRSPTARLYPEQFYSAKHRVMAEQNRLEYKMGPRSVLEEALLSGFIKRTEQTGYKAQKPVSVIEPLIRMTAKPGELVIDPTAGSGTSGEAAVRLGCAVILSDRAPAALKVCRNRLKGWMDGA